MPFNLSKTNFCTHLLIGISSVAITHLCCFFYLMDNIFVSIIKIFIEY